MKKINAFIRNLTVFLVKKTTNMFHSASSAGMSGTRVLHESHFEFWGPRLLIVGKDKNVRFLGHAFSVEIIYNEQGKCISCKPRFMTLKEGEICFWGRSANFEYQKVQYNRSS
ncbi:MAG: hypothetical protein WCO58_03200 [bacterium]